MKIAVIGGGFCGLACSWYLSEKADVVLYDQQKIGAGASGLQAGLLHPYAGPKAMVSWQAHAALAESIILLDIANKAKGSAVYSARGILRPQIASMDFTESLKYPDVSSWDAKECLAHIPKLASLPGLFIHSGITVNCPAYLEGLWLACQQKNVIFKQATILNPSDITGYDYIVFTVGAGLNKLMSIEHPPISLIKGQALQLEWPYKDPLPFAVNAGIQFSQIEPTSVWAGATYERNWTHDGPDKKAEDEIRRKIALFSPEFSKLALRATWTSFRAATNDKKPFITHTEPNIYCLGGMGSKGLLYHAYMAKKLSKSIFNY